MNPLLPQQDPDKDRRKQQLDERRSVFRWSHEYLPPLALVFADGPGNTQPSDAQAAKWVQVGVYTTPGLVAGQYQAGRLAALGNIALNDLATQGRASALASFEDYSQLFAVLRLPPVVETWSTDFEFAYQRLGGVNPLSIRRVDEVPANFAITNERLGGLLRPGKTLESEGEEGRLFLCDYSILEGLPSVTDKSGTRSVIPVLGLFHVDADDPRGPRLVPLAIQLGLDPRPSAVYTPRDGKAWLMAKICFQCADASYHEMGPHLLGTHFMEEAFMVALTRQVATNHPLFKLLSRHFEQLEANNFAGRRTLINEGGRVDTLMGGPLESSLRIVRRTYEGYPARGVKPWSFEEWDLPLSIAARRVEGIPDFPYIEDGRLVWDAIQRFVTAYLRIYYRSDADVVEDHELQAWMRDLTAEDGGHVRGVPSSIEGVPQLVNVMTRLIYACGPLHSAINFSQYDAMAFTPNMPLALYATPPDDAGKLSDAEITSFIKKLLPPREKAVLQLQTITALVSIRSGKLGKYGEGDFNDPRALRAVGVFQKDLEAIEEQIIERNLDRQLRGRPAYRFLMPSQIVPSSSV